MKAKINRGGGFRGAVAYVLDKGASETVGGNMSGLTVDALTKEFGITKKLRPDSKNPVWHCSLALPEGDRLSAQKWDEISADFMIEMGMNPYNYLYTVQRHSDTEFDHVHIVASRIGLDAQLWHGQHDVLRAIEATQKLEKRHQLTLTTGFDLAHKKDCKSLTAQEINMAVRTETKPPRLVAQEAVDAVLREGDVMSAPQFIKRLEAFGVRAVPSVASTGTMNGFSFECEGIPFTGSKLGESFKWAQLQKRGIEYVQSRDFEELADAKRVAANRAAVAQPGAAAAAGGRPGNAELGAIADIARGSLESFGSVRPGVSSPAPNAGGLGAGAGQPSDGGHGAKDGSAGRVNRDAGQSSEGLAIEHAERGGKLQKVVGAAERADRDSKELIEADAKRSQGLDDGNRSSQAARVADTVPAASGVDVGRVANGGWASRFKQNSAAKRLAAERGVGRQSVGAGDGKRAPVADSDRIQARQIDPTVYLESRGFEVKKEGRHLSVRQGGDEVYRCTKKEDGHWVTCDKYENGVGDNIALVADIEPGTGFVESVYRLSGAPSVSSVIRPVQVPAVRLLPEMPLQASEDIERGRKYLESRGISLQTIEAAEKTGMLRYSAGGVLFIGVDEFDVAQNITRRSVDPLEEIQKRDLRGSDKQHPQILRGARDTVLIVEGGTDALAAWEVARRLKQPAPTVLVSGGANVRIFMQTVWVQKVLKLAKKVVVAFERERTPEAQAKTDAAHQLQILRLREVCSADVMSWKPPEGVKDLAELNAQQIEQMEQRKQAQQAQERQAPRRQPGPMRPS